MRIIIMTKDRTPQEGSPRRRADAAALPIGPLLFGAPEAAESLRRIGMRSLACAEATVSDRTPKERVLLIGTDRAGYEALRTVASETVGGEIPFAALAEAAEKISKGSLLCASLPSEGPIAVAVGAERRFAEEAESAPTEAKPKRKGKSLDELRGKLAETEEEIKRLSEEMKDVKAKAMRNFSKRTVPTEGVSEEERVLLEERLRRDEEESKAAAKELPRAEGKIRRRRKKADALLSEIREIEEEAAERKRFEREAERKAKTASRLSRTDYAERKAKPYADAFGKAFVALVPKDSETAERTKALAERLGISAALQEDDGEDCFLLDAEAPDGRAFFLDEILTKETDSKKAAETLEKTALDSLSILIPDADAREKITEAVRMEVSLLPNAERAAKAVEIIRKASASDGPASGGIRTYGGKGCFSSLPYALGLTPTDPSGLPKTGNPPDLALLYTDETGREKFERYAEKAGAIRVGRAEGAEIVPDDGAFFFPDEDALGLLPTVEVEKGAVLAVSVKAGNLPGTVVRTVVLPKNAAAGEAVDSIFRTLGRSARMNGFPVPDFSGISDDGEAADKAADARLEALEKEFPKETIAAELNASSDRAERKRLLLKCRLSGIRVMPPDLNRSAERYSAEQEGILTGLSAVKGAEGQASVVTEARGKGYEGFADFIERCPASSACVRSLIKSGALDAFSPSRKGMLLAYERLRRRAERLRTLEARISEKEGASGDGTDAAAKSASRDREEAAAIRRMMKEFRIPSEKKETRAEKAAMEASVLPISATGSVLDEYDGIVPGMTGAGEVRIGDRAAVLGIVSSVGFSGRSGSVFFTIADGTGKLRAVMTGEAAAECASSVRDGEAVVAFGSVREDKRYGGPILTVYRAASPETFRPQVVVAWDGVGEKPKPEGSVSADARSGGRIIYYDRSTGLLEPSDFFAGDAERDGRDVAEVRKKLKLENPQRR